MPVNTVRQAAHSARRACARSLLFVGLAAALAGCTAKPTGYSDFDVETDFRAFRSFAFLPEKTLMVTSPNPPNPALEPTLIEETRKTLVRKGYRFEENPADADFLVGFTVGGTPTARSTAFTSNRRQVYVVGETQLDQVVTQESTQAGLVIDLTDPSSGQKKWMGWAIQEITMGDLKRLRLTVHELVGIILQHFPPDIPDTGE